jgi:hypothetical protein
MTSPQLAGKERHGDPTTSPQFSGTKRHSALYPPQLAGKTADQRYGNHLIRKTYGRHDNDSKSILGGSQLAGRCPQSRGKTPQWVGKIPAVAWKNSAEGWK